MELIKNFHIFGRTLPVTLTGIADRMFSFLYVVFVHPLLDN